MDFVTGMHMFTKGAGTMAEKSASFGLAGKIIMCLLLVFWIVMLYQCLRANFKVATDKVAWALAIVFLPVMGAVLFAVNLAMRRKKGKK